MYNEFDHVNNAFKNMYQLLVHVYKNFHLSDKNGSTKMVFDTQMQI